MQTDTVSQSVLTHTMIKIAYTCTQYTHKHTNWHPISKRSYTQTHTYTIMTYLKAFPLHTHTHSSPISKHSNRHTLMHYFNVFLHTHTHTHTHTHHPHTHTLTLMSPSQSIPNQMHWHSICNSHTHALWHRHSYSLPPNTDALPQSATPHTQAHTKTHWHSIPKRSHTHLCPISKSCRAACSGSRLQFPCPEPCSSGCQSWWRPSQNDTKLLTAVSYEFS
jgi:hypothetical protein